ncbi:hypothetical protein C461_01142 [Halorubrum aidingense JCM 13560]|uniref:Uncharacterized protein n=1 Tax=Halorubrum aidingense JCM 13560 TaxID=1230454 RepID=M0PKF3_9EURY|nr:hypothetical protein [Halorubrum aidingense]EMA70536.1 hypothetical protein C461_01142 [Halorubrum aidingense JCM 13560]
MTRRNALLDAICSQRDQIPLILAVCAVMGLLLVFPLVLLERGTAGYTIAVIDGLLVLGCLALFGPTYWYCVKREMD